MFVKSVYFSPRCFFNDRANSVTLSHQSALECNPTPISPHTYTHTHTFVSASTIFKKWLFLLVPPRLQANNHRLNNKSHIGEAGVTAGLCVQIAVRAKLH